MTRAAVRDEVARISTTVSPGISPSTPTATTPARRSSASTASEPMASGPSCASSMSSCACAAQSQTIRRSRLHLRSAPPSCMPRVCHHFSPGVRSSFIGQRDAGTGRITISTRPVYKSMKGDLPLASACYDLKATPSGRWARVSLRSGQQLALDYSWVFKVFDE